MMNFDAKCQGKWTHVIRTTGASSVLDYVVTDRYLKEHIVDMVIDESTLLCPFTTTRSKGKISSTLSDHNPILIKLDVPRIKVVTRDVESTWIYRAENFPRMAEILTEKCSKLVKDNQEAQSLYNSFEEMIETTLDECFKKTKPQKSNSSFKGQVHNSLGLLCRNLTKFAARGKVQRKVAEQYRDLILKLNTEKVAEVNNQKLLKRVESLAEDDHFSAQKFWKAKKSIEGSQQNCHSVLDENGIEVYEPESIIKNCLKERV